MKKRLKKIFKLNKKFADKHGGEINCVYCGLGYNIHKKKPRGLINRKELNE